MPSTIRWTGGAARVAKIIDYVFGAGAWVAGEKITVTIGSKQWSYTLVSTVIDTEAALMVTAYNALSDTDYAEMTELTASYTAATNKFRLTMDTAGKGFTATLSTDSALGTVDAGASSAGTVVTQNGGPQSLRSLKNYSGGALPVNGDTLIFDWTEDTEDNAILYDLDVLSAVTLTVRRVYASFEAKIGLPLFNTDSTAYPEYRPRYMAVGITTDFIGEGEGEGSARLMTNYGSVLTTQNVFQSQDGEDDLPAVLSLGTNASNVCNVTKGDCGWAVHGGESSTLLTLNVSYEQNVESDATVHLGVGVTLGTVNKVGGELFINSAVATQLYQEAGQTTIDGTGAVADLQLQGGTVIYNTTGALNGYPRVAAGAVLNFNYDKRTKTVANVIEVHGQGLVLDDNKVVTSLVQDENNITVPGWGKNLRLTREAIDATLNIAGGIGDIIAGFVPADLQTAQSGQYVSMAAYRHLSVVFFKSTGTNGDDPIITLQQAQDAAGTGVKALNFVDVGGIKVKQGADVLVVTAWTTITASTGIHTLSANAYSNTDGHLQAIYSIEIDRNALDLAGGFNFVRVTISDVGLNADLGCVLYVPTRPF